MWEGIASATLLRGVRSVVRRDDRNSRARCCGGGGVGAEEPGHALRGLTGHDLHAEAATIDGRLGGCATRELGTREGERGKPGTRAVQDVRALRAVRLFGTNGVGKEEAVEQ